MPPTPESIGAERETLAAARDQVAGAESGLLDRIARTDLAAAAPQAQQLRVARLDYEARYRAFVQLVTPAQAAATLTREIPLLLHPVRLQTRFRLGNTPPELWVRIFPDDFAIETHEPELTLQEFADGVAYFHAVWPAGTDLQVQVTRERTETAWGALVDTYGAGRGTWIVRRFETEEYVTNLADRPSGPDGPGEPTFVDPALVDLRPDSWTRPPRTRLLPDRFMVRLYRAGAMLKEQVGRPIPDPLVIGLDPFGIGGEEAAEWIESFDRPEPYDPPPRTAVEVGLGIKIDLSGVPEPHLGFDRVVALGLKTSRDAAGSAVLLGELIRSHHYTEGFRLPLPETPTNNLAGAPAGYTRAEEPLLKSLEREFGPPLVTAPGEDEEPRTNAGRLARALGIDVALFERTLNAGAEDDRDAEHMHTLVWPCTWGHYLEMMLGSTVPPWASPATRRHFLTHVRAQGPFTAVQCGRMPYGVLPTSALSQWQEDATDASWLSDPVARAEDVALNRALPLILRELRKRWKAWAADPAAVPRAGASDDPEEELLRLVAMTHRSVSCHVTPIGTDDYTWNLLRFIGAGVIDAGWPVPVGLQDAVTAELTQWWEGMEATKEPARQLLADLAAPTDKRNPLILGTMPWYPGVDWTEPLVIEAEKLDTAPFDGNGGYLQNWLRSEPYASMRGGSYPSTSLLFDVVRHSILWHERAVSTGEPSETRVWAQPSLDYLGGLSGRMLERLLLQALDVGTSRLDAWVTSLATKRLWSMRATASEGIHLGAYGWLENLKPAAGPPNRFGSIHAPTITHAETAAVLGSAYLSHQNSPAAGGFAPKLSSERVRRALFVLDGVRQGQKLGALLGYRFERDLFEHYLRDGLELGAYVAAFRRAYPLTAGKDTPTDPGEPAEALAARNVVDGVAMVEAWRSGTIPFGASDSGLPAASGATYTAITGELDRLNELLDAVTDLVLAESVYQAVQSNPLRGSAALDALGGQAVAPEPEVAETRTGRLQFTHRVALLFSGDPPGRGQWSESPRGKAEPFLDGWVAGLLGDPRTIACTVLRADGTLAAVVFASELAIGALDFLYLVKTDPQGEATELEQLIIHQARAKANVARDVVLRLNTSRAGFTDTSWRSLPELLPLAGRLLAVIGRPHLLRAADLRPPDQADTPAAGTYSAASYQAVIDDRITPVLDDAFDTHEALQNAATAAEARDGLAAARAFAIPDTVPAGALEDDAATFTELQSQVLRALGTLQRRIARHEVVLAEADAMRARAAGLGAEQEAEAIELFRKAAERLCDSARELFGGATAILPAFQGANGPELTEALGAAAALLAGEPTWRVEQWYQAAAAVHPTLRDFEAAMMVSRAAGGDGGLSLAVAQLPHTEGGRWLALPLTPEQRDAATAGSLSLVLQQVGAFDYTKPLRGIVLDNWDEGIPDPEVTSGLVYHFDEPNSEPPNALLLVVPPVREAEGEGWDLEHVIGAVNDTLDLAKERAVDLDALRDVGRLIPVNYLRAQTQDVDV